MARGSLDAIRNEAEAGTVSPICRQGEKLVDITFSGLCGRLRVESGFLE